MHAARTLSHASPTRRMPSLFYLHAERVRTHGQYTFLRAMSTGRAMLMGFGVGFSPPILPVSVRPDAAAMHAIFGAVKLYGSASIFMVLGLRLSLILIAAVSLMQPAAGSAGVAKVQNMVSPFSGAESGFASSCVMCAVACKRS